MPTAAAHKWDMNKVKANFNMVFDHGSFTKGDLYDYSFNEKKEKYEVKTKQDRIQSFYLSEFNTFFTIAALENIKK